MEGKGGAMVFAACILSFKKLIIKYKENLKKISLWGLSKLSIVTCNPGHYVKEKVGKNYFSESVAETHDDM